MKKVILLSRVQTTEDVEDMFQAKSQEVQATADVEDMFQAKSQEVQVAAVGEAEEDYSLRVELIDLKNYSKIGYLSNIEMV